MNKGPVDIKQLSQQIEARPLTPQELGNLAQKMVDAKTPQEGDRLQKELVDGFFGHAEGSA